MSKKLLLWIAVALVVIVGLGPIMIGKIGKHFFKTPKYTEPAAISIKAQGTISLVNDIVILTSPKGTNNYILIGSKLKELKKLASDKNTVFVFGKLMAADRSKVNDLSIMARIDVSQFDRKDLNIGSSLSPQFAESLKTKVNEKIEFERATLKKLGLSDSGLSIIAGNLEVFDCTVQGKPMKVLAVIDKYGDRYMIFASYMLTEKYKKVATMVNTPVVVTGFHTFPDPNIVVGFKNFVTFAYRTMYDENLKELKYE